MNKVLLDIDTAIRQYMFHFDHYPKYLYMSLKTLDTAGYEEVIKLCSYDIYGIKLRLDESIETGTVYVADEERN
uniref:Uncharacterized protein n=1 Tax=viral metagenome TaxID=1070528 RepID=A0A6H1ZCF3_9ZZZZ